MDISRWIQVQTHTKMWIYNTNICIQHISINMSKNEYGRENQGNVTTKNINVQKGRVYMYIY